MAGLLQRLILGPPLPTEAAGGERLTRPRAMGAFGLDALSSVAYGPDEILYVLILAGSAGVAFNLPIAVAIAALLAIVAFSYRQTIYAYPTGGGSYTVARENLGTGAGLVAAAALMVDYLTTVAVSVTAGVAAIVAFVPALDRHRVIVDVAVVVLLIVINLRGVREAGAAFVVPTYAFILSLAALLVVGLIHVLGGSAPHHLHAIPHASEGVTVFLILRAFAGGCTAMTGVEAIANGVPAFRDPASRNAAATLTTLALILAALFLGVAALGHALGAVPSDQANVLAQIARAYTGSGSPLFYAVQLSAAAVLVLAANTSFNGFPRLAAILADDDWIPHRLSHRGLRLAYSNGIIGIGVAAIVLIVAFGGSTHHLIPLFAVGVFLCFTLSQAGMVQHWRRTRGDGWRRRAAINATGAVATAIVTVIVVATKFVAGAWIVIVLVPAIVALFRFVHRHYERADAELSLERLPSPAGGPRQVLVPVNRLNRATAAAVEYALSIGDDVRAVHLSVEKDDGDFAERWRRWSGGKVPLEVVPSPYREVVAPFVDVVKRRAARSETPVTVVVPALVSRHLWQEPLHNQLEYAITLALLRTPNVVVASVPVQLTR